MISATIANVNRDPKKRSAPYTAFDFAPARNKPKPQADVDAEQYFSKFFASHGIPLVDAANDSAIMVDADEPDFGVFLNGKPH